MSLLNAKLGSKAPDSFNVVIEIPKGSTNKYEVDAQTGILRLDRVLFSPLYYPYDYGYVPQTLYQDGDPIDTFVVLSHPTFPGCMVDARPIGVLEMRDEKGPDEKVLCVATQDPRFQHWQSIKDLSPHRQMEIIHFFETYKTLERKEVEVIGWKDIDVAKELIQRYRVDIPRS